MVVKSDADTRGQRSHLFTLRLWPEDVGGGETDWRGKIQHVASGETRYFRDWLTLEAFVEGLLRGCEAEGSGAATGEESGAIGGCDA